LCIGKLRPFSSKTWRTANPFKNEAAALLGRLQIASGAKEEEVFSNLAKRWFDVVFSCLALIISLPLLIICAIAIRVESGGPALFRQIRVGRHGRHFQMLKLRSMTNVAENNGPMLTVSGDPRITRVGRLLRATKVDELPQLYNVIQGHMSLVGPRPEVPKYVATYTARQKQILNFKPGITGPASLGYIREETLLSGEKDPDMFYRQTVLPRKLELDLEYCEKANFFTDLRLLAKTILHLIQQTSHFGHN